MANGIDVSSSLQYTTCDGSVDIELVGADDYDWTWTPSTGLNVDTGSAVTVNTKSTVTYTANGVGGACGTINRDITIIYDTVPIPVDAGPDVTICAGGTAQLNATAPAGTDYTWSPTTGLSGISLPNPTASVLATQTYVVQASGSGGCVGEDSVTVFVATTANMNLGPDLSIFLGESVPLDGTTPGAVSYSWSPTAGISDPTSPTVMASPGQTTTYVLTATYADDCVDIDTITIEVITDINIVIPSGFTPNEDGINDGFRPLLFGAGEIIDFDVFNRWGEKVFHGEPGDSWDGKVDGKFQELDTYMVVVSVLLDSKVKIATGTVTLIR